MIIREESDKSYFAKVKEKTRAFPFLFNTFQQIQLWVASTWYSAYSV